MHDEAMIIDFHAHLFTPDACASRERYCDDRHFALLNRDPKSRIVSHAEAVSACDRGGIDYMVCMGFAWFSPGYCAAQNEYFARISRETGGRLIPFGSVPLDEPKNTGSWVREIKSMGLKGVGEIAFYGDGMTAGNIDYLDSVLGEAGALSLPVCIHVNEPVGHRYPGKYEPELRTLYQVIERHRDVTMILSHWGGGLFVYELMPEVKERLSNCYYDTAATPYLYREEIYSAALNILGERKILFGSDYPLIGPGKYVKAVTETVSDEGARAGILGGNAARILGL